MSEAATKREIMLAIGRTARVFNNPVGNGWLGNVISERGDIVTLAGARRVAFGLHKGSSDLVGWNSLLITPEHVGRTLAIFSALEVKKPGGRHPVTADQQTFIAAVLEAGGFAGAVTNAAQARHVLGLPL